MNTYKITNITDNFPKRNPKYNTNVYIHYPNGIMKKTYILKPKETFYLTIDNLPISLHKERMCGTVIINSLSEKEAAREINPPTKKSNEKKNKKSDDKPSNKKKKNVIENKSSDNDTKKVNNTSTSKKKSSSSSYRKKTTSSSKSTKTDSELFVPSEEE